MLVYRVEIAANKRGPYCGHDSSWTTRDHDNCESTPGPAIDGMGEPYTIEGYSYGFASLNAFYNVPDKARVLHEVARVVDYLGRI